MAASRIASATVVLAAAFALAGCAGSDKGSTGTGAESPESAESGTPAAAIDACTLVSAEDIEKLLGTPIEGRPTGNRPDMPGCIWENPDSYESVSVEIGAPDTAINGTLPPPEPGFPDVGTPGPDGMRMMGGGAVEFAAGKRRNNVQVAVVSMGGDAADNAAVDLARKISAQLPPG